MTRRRPPATLTAFLASIVCLSLLPAQATMLNATSFDPDTTLAHVTPVSAASADTSAAQAHTPGLGEVLSSARGNSGQMRLIVQIEPGAFDAAISALEAIPSVTVNYRYTEIFSGASLTIDSADLPQLEQIPGLSHVEEGRTYQPQMLAVNELVNGLTLSGKYSTDGRGMVIAVVDSGIDINHKDMRLDNGVEPKITTTTPTPAGTQPFTPKIPHGYNFINNSYDLYEDYDLPHGMHIAGILAANATDEEVTNKTGIDGIAPNAQLLMYRVFSDRKDTAVAVIDEKVYAAMEDAVIHGADVISLSIGDYGTGKPSDAFYKAVENAKKKGVVIAASMGNAGTSGSTTSYDRYPNDAHGGADLATTVTVAANLSVIGVGSAAHTYRESHKIQLGHDSYYYIPVSYSTVPAQSYTFVNVGSGQPADLENVDLEGKVAVVARHAEGPKAQFDRLRDKGAVGVIVYNTNLGRNRDYYATEPPQILDESVAADLWGISVSYNDGQKILASIASQAEQTLTPLGMHVEPMSDASHVSGFSSWGSTVDLELKPDLVAPGEGILSTLNKGRYGIMSGTSMSTPVVAGAAALLLPHYRDYTLPQGMNIVDVTRIMMMNTATPLMDTQGVENSPRQQGAGMLNIENALDNRVLITSQGRGAGTLKEITADTVTFTAKLDNLGNDTETFTLRTSPVATTGTVAISKNTGDTVNEVHSTPIPGATISADQQRITLAPGAHAEVTFSLNTPRDVANTFVEGYVYFESDTNPHLVLPYFGYKGDWQRDPIIDLPRWEQGNVTGLTAMMTTAPGLTKDKYILMGATDPANLRDGAANPHNIAVSSTNSDRVIGSAWMRLGVLRDLVDYRIDVVSDATPEALPLYTVQVGSFMEKFRRTDFNEIDYFGRKFSSPDERHNWQGQVYDPATGSLVDAPEGQYYVRVAARNDVNKPYQMTYLPVKVDNTLPQGALARTDEGYVVTTSDNTAVWMVQATLNGASLPVTAREDGKWLIDNVQPSDTGSNQLMVKIIDIAGNYIDLTENLPQADLIIDNLAEFIASTTAPLSVRVSDKVASLEATINDEPVSVEAATTRSASSASTWQVSKPRRLASGEAILVLTAKDADGAVVATKTIIFTHDAKRPMVDYQVEWEEEDENLLSVNDAGYTLVRGTVTDDVSQADKITGMYFINDPRLTKEEGRPITISSDGSFAVKVFASDFPKLVKFRFTDESGRWSERTFFMSDAEDEDPVSAPFFTSFDTTGAYIFYGAENLEDDDIVATGEGQYATKLTVFCDSSDYSVSLNGGERRECGDEEEVLFDVPLTEGPNTVTIAGYNEDGEFIFEGRKYFFVDLHTPVLRLEGLHIADKLASDDADDSILGTIYTNSDLVEFSGTVEDNGLEWYLRINDSIVKRGKAWREFGSNLEHFTYATRVADGDFMKIHTSDYFGNEDHDKEAKYRIKIDTDKPTVTFTPEAHYAPTAVVSPQVTDNTGLVETVYYLDGTPFDITQPLEHTGEHILRVYAKDLAGNVTDREYALSVVGPPQATLERTEIPEGQTFTPDQWLTLAYGTQAKVLETTIAGDVMTVRVLLANAFGETATMSYTLTVTPAPSVPLTPLVPAQPVIPLTPLVPAQPVDPGKPDGPTQPHEPSVPHRPSVPLTPLVPAQPHQPNEPGTNEPGGHGETPAPQPEAPTPPAPPRADGGTPLTPPGGHSPSPRADERTPADASSPRTGQLTLALTGPAGLTGAALLGIFCVAAGAASLTLRRTRR